MTERQNQPIDELDDALSKQDEEKIMRILSQLNLEDKRILEEIRILLNKYGRREDRENGSECIDTFSQLNAIVEYEKYKELFRSFYSQLSNDPSHIDRLVTFDKAALTSGGRIIYFTDGQEVIASIRIRSYDSLQGFQRYKGVLSTYEDVWNAWCIVGIDVLPNYRSKGLGSEILSKSILEIKKLGRSYVVSHIDDDNISSIKIHEKHGFKKSNSHPEIYILDLNK